MGSSPVLEGWGGSESRARCAPKRQRHRGGTATLKAADGGGMLQQACWHHTLAKKRRRRKKDKRMGASVSVYVICYAAGVRRSWRRGWQMGWRWIGLLDRMDGMDRLEWAAVRRGRVGGVNGNGTVVAGLREDACSWFFPLAMVHGWATSRRFGRRNSGETLESGQSPQQMRATTTHPPGAGQSAADRPARQVHEPRRGARGEHRVPYYRALVQTRPPKTPFAHVSLRACAQRCSASRLNRACSVLVSRQASAPDLGKYRNKMVCAAR